ncbi:MAG: deoxyribonuclease V [Candidatus Thiosymbion ectosymbiont of Robbea hypermnestra]|nr:deoxyribonuclease V [Candidatus Thiosymbion ectosymbiont of Robbea hypermnestra]
MKDLHPWDVTPAQARAIQERLRGRLIQRDDFARIATIAGIDIGFEDQGTITRAAVVLLRFPGLETLDQAVARRPTRFPYVPGLLSFREIPAALDALDRLRVEPDLLLCDGQGYAHPRRFGLACHLGLLTDLPSIGVAKSRLIGEHGTLAPHKGARTELRHAGEVIGSLLRTRAGVKPVYVSVGHRIGLKTALAYVLACAVRYRLPEPTHRAHRLASDKQAQRAVSCDLSDP